MRTQNSSNKGLYFIILILVAVFVGYSYNQGWFNSLNKKEEVKSIVKEEEKKIEKEYSLKTKEEKEEVNGSLIEVAYPYFNASIDSKIKENIFEKIADFKGSIDNSSFNVEQSLTISYDFSKYSNSIYSIKYNIVYGGGAHPVEDIECKTYDIKNSKELGLDSVFKQESGYLSKLSEVVYSELVKDSTVDKSWAKEGTSQRIDNFKNFMLEGDGIIFYFAPGIVAPNTEGVKKVEIKLSSLKYFLNNFFIK